MRAYFLVVEVVAELREEYFKPEKPSFKKSYFPFEYGNIWLSGNPLEKNWPDSGYIFAQEKNWTLKSKHL